MVVDSPLILCIVYNNDEILGESFNKTVLNVFNSYENKNYLLIRKHTYENEGRFQDEMGATKVRNHLIEELTKMNIDYDLITSSEKDCELIADMIAKEIKKNEQ